MKINGYTCERAINVIGHQRSGQHAILRWIMAQCPAPTYDISTNIWHKDGVYDKFKPAMSPQLLIMNLEGCYRRHLKSLHPTIFVVRDVKNHLASFMKHGHLSTVDFYRIWSEYARLSLGNHQYDIQVPHMCILFPLWFSSESYRKTVVTNLNGMLNWDGFAYSDAGRDSVPANGGGSSFDKMNFQGRGSEMKVLERYKAVQLPNIPEDLLMLNNKLFGPMYD